MYERFTLYSPSFGANLKGADEALIGMNFFFIIFPDYNVLTEHTAVGEDFVNLTGKVELTPNFTFLKLTGKAHKASIDFSAALIIRDNLLLKETFLVDIISLCNQSGLPLDVAMKVFNLHKIG